MKYTLKEYFLQFVVIIVISLCIVSLALISADWDIASSEQNILDELLERYSNEPRLFLEDYQNQRISPDDAIAILIMMHIEKDGIFLPLEETDTYLDYFFIHKGRHIKVKRMKQEIYPRSLKKGSYKGGK